MGGGDDFCSVGDEETGDDPFENRFSEKKKSNEDSYAFANRRFAVTCKLFQIIR